MPSSARSGNGPYWEERAVFVPESIGVVPIKNERRKGSTTFMDYDLVVIGAGPGGHAAAEESARLGARVAIVEKDKWGGVCTHCGCIPTKALLACSKKYVDIKKLKRMGIAVGEPSFDFSVMKRHQNQMVRVSSLGVQKTLKETGVECIEGEGVLVSPEDVDVVASDGVKKKIRAKHIVIAWGSRPAIFSNVEFSDRTLSSDRLLFMDTLPGSIIVVGGGAIGVEFATFLAELGTKVTLLELMDQILPNEEREAADFLEGELKKLGIDVHTSTAIDSMEEMDDGVCVRAKCKDSDREFSAEYALVCVGREPALRTEELDRLSIAYDRRGIIVNDRCMTNVENVFAVGDVTGGILLAHRAMAQGRALASDLFGGGSITYSDAAIPAVVYTHPNVARVGLTEEQAKKEGLEIEVKKVEYGGNIIARTGLMGNGFVKAMFSDGVLIGVTIVGEEAAELIAPMSLAVVNKMTIQQLRNWVIPHPTLSELLSIV